MMRLVHRKRAVWTPREIEILRILARLNGTRNAQIGAELGMAERTVKNYIARLMAKTGLPREERNRTRLSVLAVAILERIA